MSSVQYDRTNEAVPIARGRAHDSRRVPMHIPERFLLSGEADIQVTMAGSLRFLARARDPPPEQHATGRRGWGNHPVMITVVSACQRSIDREVLTTPVRQ